LNRRTKSKVRKCKKCGKKFTAVIDWAFYCSAQCEILAANPVAKHNHNRHGVHKPSKGKGSYNRRKHNRVIWDLEKEG